MVTGSLVNDIHNLLSDIQAATPQDQASTSAQFPAETREALQRVNLNSIVLASHSLGSLTAIDMLTGEQVDMMHRERHSHCALAF